SLRRNPHGAGIEKDAPCMNEFVIGRVDENCDIEVATVIAELGALHFADSKPEIVDVRPRAHVEFLRMKEKAPARRFGRHRRRPIETDKIPRRLARARVHFDVGAGKDRLQASKVDRVDARSDNPKSGARPKGVFDAAVELQLHHHMVEILAQRYIIDRADVHAFVADSGIAGLDAAGLIKGNSNRGPLVDELTQDKPADNDNGDNRNRPDPPRPAAAAHGRLGPLSLAAHDRRSAASHISRGSKAREAIIVSTTTARKATAPRPACTVANCPNCMSGTKTAMV